MSESRERDTDDHLILQVPSMMLWEQQRMNRMLVAAFIVFAAAFVMLAAALIYGIWFVDANDILGRMAA